MGYHNGSVWPHDNAIVAPGSSATASTPAAAEIAAGLFDAARRTSLPPMPELFCGLRA